MARMRIMKLTEDTRAGALEALLGRSPSGYSEYEKTVRDIIDDVRARGDQAVFELEEKFDKCVLTKETIRVSQEEIEAAYKELTPEFVEVIRRAAAIRLLRARRQSGLSIQCPDERSSRQGCRCRPYRYCNTSQCGRKSSRRHDRGGGYCRRGRNL